MLLASALLFSVTGAGCSDDNTGAQPEKKTEYDMTGFAKGVDVSWLTEMENDGKLFYDSLGRNKECLSLMQSLGCNAIRLRVWVNPADGWNGKDDVVAKAWRAQQLGFRLMIDFHYSDTWADPGNQTVPAAWSNFSADELKAAVSSHTTEVLQALKDRGCDVEWVQVGNETRDGMLFNDGDTAVTGRCSKNPANFAAYVNAGYDAVKAVYPQAKVIVHVDEGNDLGRYTWLFGQLKANGGKWDVIGMSLYPDHDNWAQLADACLSNIEKLASQYACGVVVSEVGMAWDDTAAPDFMKKMVDGCKKISACEGIFYWEPEVYGGWKPASYDNHTPAWSAYTKGAFDAAGKPTAVFDAYK